MIQFQGVEEFAGPPNELFAKLGDAGFLAGCLPDTTVQLATPDRAEWKVKPKLSFIAGTLDTVAIVTDMTVPREAIDRS